MDEDTSESDSEEMERGQSTKRMSSGSGEFVVREVVSQLQSEGFGEQLAWLEAYLSDEARDRRIDGE